VRESNALLRFICKLLAAEIPRDQDSKMDGATGLLRLVLTGLLANPVASRHASFTSIEEGGA
jgi:hypothetical protein